LEIFAMKSPRTILLENIVRLCVQAMQSSDAEMRVEASREHALVAKKLQVSMALDAKTPADSPEHAPASLDTPHLEEAHA
jgi:hypothetical protein